MFKTFSFVYITLFFYKDYPFFLKNMDGFVSGWFEFISGHFLGVLSLAQARELGIPKVRIVSLSGAENNA
jgi:hypothetical protein